MSNLFGKKGILVAYQSDERSMVEEPPESQLENSGYIVTVTNCLAFAERILREGHSTVILLADAILAKDNHDLENRFQFQVNLINLARDRGLYGIGLIVEPYFCKPYTTDSYGLSIVATDECSRFDVRDWSALLKKVERQINKRMRNENQPGNPPPPWPGSGDSKTG